MIKLTRHPDGGYMAPGWRILPDGKRGWLIAAQDDLTTVKYRASNLLDARHWIEDQASPHPGPIPLQLYGHRVDIPEDIPSVLHEVSICSTPNGLRKLAQHILSVADDMEQYEDFDHAHFHTRVSDRPEIVICRYSPERDRPIEWDDELEGWRRVE